jgi:antitoxin HigA-1
MKRKLMPPSHPGEILLDLFIKPRNLTITEVAKGLGTTRANLSVVINSRGGVSPELSVKLAAAFNNTPEFWFSLQINYELWHAKQKVNTKGIRRFLTAEKIIHA